MTSTDRLAGIELFVAAVETGGFSAAAARLHLSRSAVAKAIARLEERIGTRLFHRTTRSLALTEAGEAFHQRCTRILAELEEAQDELAQHRDEAVGRVRLTMPVLIGRRRIAPLLFALAQQHPRLQLQLAFSDRRADLVEEGFDLAIRSGPLSDSHALKMRSLGAERLALYAAPSYLARRGTPRDVAALVDHDAIAYGRGGTSIAWVQDAGPVSVPVRLWLDDLEALRDAAQAGLGITRLPSWLAEEAVRDGRLVALEHFGIATSELHAVWPQARQLPRRVRVVLDELAQRLW